jgi:hypothetical protein
VLFSQGEPDPGHRLPQFPGGEPAVLSLGHLQPEPLRGVEERRPEGIDGGNDPPGSG